MQRTLWGGSGIDLCRAPNAFGQPPQQVEGSPSMYEIPGNGETFDLPLVTGIMNRAGASPPTPRLWG